MLRSVARSSERIDEQDRKFGTRIESFPGCSEKVGGISHSPRGLRIEEVVSCLSIYPFDLFQQRSKLGDHHGRTVRWSRLAQLLVHSFFLMASDPLTSVLMEEMEKNYVQTKEQLQEATQQVSALQAQKEALQTQLSRLQEVNLEASEKENQLKLSQQKISNLEEDKKLTEERMDRLQLQADQLRDELAALQKTNVTLEQHIAESKVESSMKDSITLQHEITRLQTELDALQAHATWLQDELRAQTQALQHANEQHRDRQLQLQLQLNTSVQEQESLQAQVDEYQKLERQLQDKLTQVTQDVRDRHVQLEDLRETSDLSLRKEQKLVQLQKEQLDRWQARYNDVVRDNEALQSAAAQALQLQEQEIQAVRKELSDKYDKMLQEQVAEMEAKRPRLKGSVALLLTDGEEDEMEDEDPSEPMGLVDLYEKLDKAQKAFREERRRANRAEALNESIRREVAEKVPLLQRQREEYEMAMEQRQELHSRLEQAFSDKEDALAENKELRRQVERHRKVAHEQKIETQELAKQVQGLLLSRSGGQVGDDIPTSVQEIQSQNQRLLVEHRTLTDKVAELERQLEDDPVREKLKASESELEQLRRDRQEQEVLASRIAQQRDLYRALLNKHDAGLLDKEESSALEIVKQQADRALKSEQKVKELQSDIISLESESSRNIRDREAAEEKLARYETLSADLKESVGSLEREVLVARGDVARAQADSQYYKERCDRLEDQLKGAREESKHVFNSKNELQRITVELQSSLANSQAMADKAKVGERQAEMKMRLLETQVETAKACERRVNEENKRLRLEVSRLGALIDSIKSIESGISARNQGELAEAKAEIERLRKSKESADARYAQELETLKSSTADSDIRAQQLESKRASLQEELLSVKDQNHALENEKNGLKEEVARLQVKLRSARKKLGETDDAEDAEVALQSRIHALESELEGIRSQLEDAQKSAESYQKLAKTAESALDDLNRSLTDLKGKRESELEEAEAKIKSLEETSRSHKDIIADLTRDLSGQREEQEKVVLESNARIQQLEKEVEKAAQDVEAAVARVESLKLDLAEQTAEVATQRSNYERELQLHSQARSALRSSREEAQAEHERRREVEDKCESLKAELAELHGRVQQETSSSKDSMSALEARLSESTSQNAVLHSQLETLEKIIERQKKEKLDASDVASSLSTAEADDLQKLAREQSEIIRFLKSENELIQGQLDSAKRAGDRELASTDMLRRTIDELRAEIVVLRKEVEQSKNPAPPDSSAQLKNALDQLSLLRDSNQLQREEAEKYQKGFAELQQQLDAVQKDTAPLLEEKRELESKILSLESEKASLRRDLDAWKGRVETLVSKFNQVDPEEHSKLLKKLEEMTAEKESLNAWKKTTEEENTRIREIARSLNQKLREQKNQFLVQKQELDKTVAEKEVLAKASTESTQVAGERDELTKKVESMTKTLESLKTELAGANSRSEDLRAKLRQAISTMRDLKAKNKELEAKASTVHEKEDTGTTDEAPPSEAPPEVAETLVTRDPPSDSEKHAASSDGTSTVDLPQVPERGFRFGPSPSDSKQQSTMTESTKPVTQAKPESSLRAAAPTFQPKVASMESDVSAEETSTEKPQGTKSPVPGQSAGEKMEPESKDPVTKVAVPDSKPSRPPSAVKPPASEKKEVSIKEKLLERKRQLAEMKEKKRKMEEEMAKATTEGDKKVIAGDQVTKKPRLEVAESQEESIAEKTSTAEPVSEATDVPKLSEPDDAAPTRKGLDTIEEIREGEEGEAEDSAMEAVDTTSASQDEKGEASAESKPAPFGMAPNPFATSAPAPIAVVFGQSSTIAGGGFGAVATSGTGSFGSAPVNPAAFGGAFLNIKPPGSSATPPTFSFGSSSTIKLPTPSQNPPAISPFGAFNTPTTSFGSSAPAPAVSLFGAPPPQQPTEEESKTEPSKEGEASGEG